MSYKIINLSRKSEASLIGWACDLNNTIIIIIVRTANGQSFTMVTVKGHEFTFTSNNAEEVCSLITYFLEGLKKRSKFVIATMDYQSPGMCIINR